MMKYIHPKYLHPQYTKNLAKKYTKKIKYFLFTQKYKNQIFNLLQTNINDSSIFIVPQDNTSKQIFLFKNFEQKTTKILKKMIKKDWICFDIGANIGYYTLLFAKIAYKGKIYSFEPNPLINHVLSINALSNGYTHCNIYLNALSNEKKELTFSVAKDSGLSSFKENNRQGETKQIKVQSTTLDNFTKTHNIHKIDLVKIDIEGAEMLMLQGATETLKNTQPQVLIIEMCQENFDTYQTSIQAIIKFLSTFKYKPFIASTNQKLIPYNNIDNRSYNMFFIHENAEKELL